MAADCCDQGMHFGELAMFPILLSDGVYWIVRKLCIQVQLSVTPIVGAGKNPRDCTQAFGLHVDLAFQVFSGALNLLALSQRVEVDK